MAQVTLVTEDQVGAIGGPAGPLDGQGRIPSSQVAAVSMNTVWPAVASQAAMLALPAEPGDVAIRTDLSQEFMLVALPANNIANWAEFLSPASPVQSVNGHVGVVALTAADVGALTQAAGDVRYDSFGAAAGAQAASDPSGSAATALNTATLRAWLYGLIGI